MQTQRLSLPYEKKSALTKIKSENKTETKEAGEKYTKTKPKKQQQQNRLEETKCGKA